MYNAVDLFSGLEKIHLEFMMHCGIKYSGVYSDDRVAVPFIAQCMIFIWVKIQSFIITPIILCVMVNHATYKHFTHSRNSFHLPCFEGQQQDGKTVHPKKDSFVRYRL